MSQFAREHPEDYEERLEAMIEGADLRRKEEKESGFFGASYSNPEKGNFGKIAKLDAEIARQQEEDRKR